MILPFDSYNNIFLIKKIKGKTLKNVSPLLSFIYLIILLNYNST
jgi:hypothetical protein